MKSYVYHVFFVLNITAVVFAQTPDTDLRNEIEEIKQTQREMQKDLSEIKALLSRMPGLSPSQNPSQKPASPQPPQVNIKGIEFDIGGNPVMGRESAKYIVVEFTDYQCPFCGRYARETFPQIRKHYVDKGIVRYSVIDQPLPIHPDAAKAAEASHCAGDQGKFWEMHEAMMADQEALKDLSSYARKLKLNIGQFEECLNTNKYGDAVRNDTELASKLGMVGVPGFIIGTVDESSARKVDVPFARPCDRWENGTITTVKTSTVSVIEGAPEHDCSPKGLVMPRHGPRRFLVDEEAGVVVAYLRFGSLLPDFHMFRIRNGRIDLIQSVIGANAGLMNWTEDNAAVQ